MQIALPTSHDVQRVRDLCFRLHMQYRKQAVLEAVQMRQHI